MPPEINNIYIETGRDSTFNNPRITKVATAPSATQCNNKAPLEASMNLVGEICRPLPRLVIEFSYVHIKFPRFGKAVGFRRCHPKGNLFRPHSPRSDIEMTISEFHPEENIDLRRAVSKVENKSPTLWVW
jgi:hypothetical protein